MASEAFQRKAEAINETSTLITRLSNIQSAIGDFDRLRLDGARFLSPEDEEFQEFMADLDGIRAMLAGAAGAAIQAEMKDSRLIEHFCAGSQADLDENDLRAFGGAIECALAKAQGALQKILEGD